MSFFHKTCRHFYYISFMKYTVILLLTIGLAACVAPDMIDSARVDPGADSVVVPTGTDSRLAELPAGMDELVLGGGCFWCLEAAFELVPGVLSVESGYSGGERPNPDYRTVSLGASGHAEVVRIVYDPAQTSLELLFDLFFTIHDPTTPNRQGADIGPQYRSIILYRDDVQLKAAQSAIGRAGSRYENAVVTELQPLERFWIAEEYHQDYFAKNPDAVYCRLVVAPKVDKTLQFLQDL